MSRTLFDRTPLDEAFTALRKDVLHEDGPRISTMRNYRFAILQYEPNEEYRLRSKVRRLSSELVAGGWTLLSVDLQKLMLDRIRRQDTEHESWIERVIAMEKRLGGERGRNYLRDKLVPLLEGADGLAADCVDVIRAHTERHAEHAETTLVLVGRVGALYPFFSPSALLRHLDGRTENLPVVLLYPGERRGATGLSFMGVRNADSDYRPRIYP